jgi:hypothetical protein
MLKIMGFRTAAAIWLFMMSFLVKASPGNDQIWDFDSIRPATNTGAPPTAGEQVYSTLMSMLGSWNAHDLDKFLTYFWNSPELLYVVDERQLTGWQAVHDSFSRGYANPDEMGYITPDRVQIRMMRPDLAFALTSWTIRFPLRRTQGFGLDTMYLQKFDQGWKIIQNHTSVAEQ